MEIDLFRLMVIALAIVVSLQIPGFIGALTLVVLRMNWMEKRLKAQMDLLAKQIEPLGKLPDLLKPDAMQKAVVEQFSSGFELALRPYVAEVSGLRESMSWIRTLVEPPDEPMRHVREELSEPNVASQRPPRSFTPYDEESATIAYEASKLVEDGEDEDSALEIARQKVRSDDPL